MAERFRRVLDEVTPLNRTEVWADTETGVQYLYHQRGGDSAGLAVLLGPDGKPLLYRPEDCRWAATVRGGALPIYPTGGTGMERDLYAVVRRGSTHRRDWRMWAALCLVLALAVTTLVPILWSAHYQLRYRDLLIKLSRSTS